MSLPEQVSAGQRAKRLLEDPAVVAAFDAVRMAIIERWESTPLRDRDGAHELKLMLRLLADLRANLEQAITNGKIAAEELRQLNRSLSPAEWRELTR